MPHCIIEYSIDLEQENDFKEVTKLINKTIEDSNLFDNKTIKTRTFVSSNYLIGGLSKSFIHITVKLLEGRTKEQKQTLATELLKTASEIFKSTNDITVEITDLNPNFYFKRTVI